MPYLKGFRVDFFKKSAPTSQRSQPRPTESCAQTCAFQFKYDYPHAPNSAQKKTASSPKRIASGRQSDRKSDSNTSVYK